MGDRVYLSLWLDEFSTEAMLPAWAMALAEIPVLEQSFQEGSGVGESVALAAEFLHEDYAYEVDLNWDVWVPREPGSLDQWEKVAQTVSGACLGAQFGAEDT